MSSPHAHEQLPLFSGPQHDAVDPREAEFDRLMDTGQFNALQARELSGWTGDMVEAEVQAGPSEEETLLLPAVPPMSIPATGHRRLEVGDNDVDPFWNPGLHGVPTDGADTQPGTTHRQRNATLAKIGMDSVRRAAKGDPRYILAITAARHDKRKRGQTA